MDRKNVIANINYDFNKKLLLSYFYELRDTGIPYEDYRGKLDEWNIIRLKEFDYYNQICKDLGVSGEPRFYELKENTILPQHKDHGTQCSINVLLSGDAAPIQFGDYEFFYDQCLLNTQENHGVNNGSTPRILFKISIKDRSFNTVRDILDSNGLLSY